MIFLSHKMRFYSYFSYIMIYYSDFSWFFGFMNGNACSNLINVIAILCGVKINDSAIRAVVRVLLGIRWSTIFPVAWVSNNWWGSTASMC